jgi:predicted phage tail protein
MRTVRLYGDLATQFGREFKLDVVTPAQAVRALCAMIPAFKRRLMNDERLGGRGFHVRVGKEYRGENDITNPCAGVEIIRILPATAGSSAALRIIVGVVLVAASVFLYAADGGILMSMGVALILGGVAQLLAPKPPTDPGGANRPKSYLFGNGVNTIGQGPVIAVGYGRWLWAPHVISGQVFSDEVPLSLEPDPSLPTAPTDAESPDYDESGDTISYEAPGVDDQTAADVGGWGAESETL